MSVVLDASALLAYLQDEPGGERVREVIAHSVMSTVNWAEVIGKARDDGVDTRGLKEDLASLGLVLEPLSAEQAETSGRSRNGRDEPDSRSVTGRASRSGAIGARPSTRRTVPGCNWSSAWMSR